MLPQKSMLEAFKKRIESLGDQQWKCFFGRPDRAMNLENQEIEVYLIGNFHEDIKTESFLERAKNTSEFIKAYGGKLTGIYGYLFFPEEDEKKQEVCNQLCKIEAGMKNAHAALNHVVLVSEKYKDAPERLLEMLLDITQNQEIKNSQDFLFGKWRLLKQESRTERASYCYNGFGYHKMIAEYRDRDRIVKKAIQNLLSEKRWMNTEESSTTDEVLEEGRVTILEKQKEISVFEIIKEYTVLPESSVDITRAEINARKIKNFEQSFIKAEKVEQGLLELESSFRGYFQWIREKTQKYLLDYGPVVAKRFLYGDRNTSGLLERIKTELKKQIEENIPERKRRPVRQIVGLMTEAEEQKKIALWKEDFRRALESEIAVEIVKQFLEQGDDGTVFSEIQKYAKRVSELAEYLENAQKQKENWDNGQYEVIEGVQNAEIERWADNRIAVWLRRDQICEKIRQKIVNIILSGPVDVEKTAEAEIEGNVTEKAGITVEHCIEETNQECGVEIVKKLLEQSRPMLNMDTRDKNRCAYIFLPEELAKKEKWEEIMETCKPWFPQIHIQVEKTKNTEKISCIQTSLANSVYDWKKMQPELKNITLERSAVSKTAEQTKQNVQTRANEQSAKNIQTNRKAAESSDQNVSQSFRRASENAEKTASEPVRLNPRFCKFCGAQLKKGTEKFCPLCGKSLYRK